MFVLVSQNQINIPGISVADNCGPRTAEGCCIGKGESWCLSLKECVSPSVKLCPSGGGTTPPKTPITPGTQLCPSGGAPGIRKATCESTFCGGGYDATFYNDNDGNGVACCKCNLKQNTPAPPVAENGASCAGPFSANACKNLNVGDTFFDICRCERTSGMNCGCVGLNNVAAGGACSADTNCVSGTSCVSGTCSAAKAGERESCKFDNDCAPGLACSGSICALPKVTGIACGTGLCPAVGEYKCENNKCRPVAIHSEDDLRGTRLPEVVAKEEDPFKDYGMGVVFDSDSLEYFSLTSCSYYSNTAMVATYKSKTREYNRVIKGYFCCNGASSNVITDEQAAYCEANNEAVGEGVSPKVLTSWKALNPVIIQSDPVIGAVKLNINGQQCRFSKVGCGPTSISRILNNNGTPIHNPLEILGSYDSFSCDYGSKIEDNIEVINSFGLATEEIDIDTNEKGELTEDSIEEINEYIEDGNQALILVKVKSNGREFGHYAVIEGVNSDGEFLIFDPYFNEDGTVKDLATAEEYLTLNRIDPEYLSYTVQHVVIVSK